MSAPPAPAGVWTIYRCYGDEGELLYVGYSGAGLSRLMQHTAKQWWPMTKFVLTQHFETRDAAVRAERHAIETEYPVFNAQVSGWTPDEIADAKDRARQLLHNLNGVSA